METWLYTKLAPLVTEKVFGGMAPPNTTTPYIVFKQVSGVKDHLDADTEYRSERWQIDSYAGGDYTAGRTLVKQIRDVLDVRGVDSGLCILSSDFDSEDAYDEKVEQHYQSSDLTIDYQGE